MPRVGWALAPRRLHGGSGSGPGSGPGRRAPAGSDGRRRHDGPPVGARSQELARWPGSAEEIARVNQVSTPTPTKTRLARQVQIGFHGLGHPGSGQHRDLGEAPPTPTRALHPSGPDAEQPLRAQRRQQVDRRLADTTLLRPSPCYEKCCASHIRPTRPTSSTSPSRRARRSCSLPAEPASSRPRAQSAA